MIPYPFSISKKVRVSFMDLWPRLSLVLCYDLVVFVEMLVWKLVFVCLFLRSMKYVWYTGTAGGMNSNIMDTMFILGLLQLCLLLRL